MKAKQMVSMVLSLAILSTMFIVSCVPTRAYEMDDIDNSSDRDCVTNYVIVDNRGIPISSVMTTGLMISKDSIPIYNHGKIYWVHSEKRDVPRKEFEYDMQIVSYMYVLDVNGEY